MMNDDEFNKRLEQILKRCDQIDDELGKFLAAKKRYRIKTDKNYKNKSDEKQKYRRQTLDSTTTNVK